MPRTAKINDRISVVNGDGIKSPMDLGTQKKEGMLAFLLYSERARSHR